MPILDDAIVPSQIQGSEGALPPVPPADYMMMAIDSSYKTNSKQTGKTIEYTYLIAEGPYKDRTIKKSYNYRHDNPDAERIGRAELSDYLHAIDLQNQEFRDTQVAHNRLFIGSVGTEYDEKAINPKNGKPYPAKNIVTEFKNRYGLSAKEIRKQAEQARGNPVHAAPAAPQPAVNYGGGNAAAPAGGYASNPGNVVGQQTSFVPQPNPVPANSAPSQSPWNRPAN